MRRVRKRELVVGSVVRTTEGMERVGTVERIDVTELPELFVRGRRVPARTLKTLMVRWQDDPSGGFTEVAPEVVSTQGIPVIEGLVLIGRLAG